MPLPMPPDPTAPAMPAPSRIGSILETLAPAIIAALAHKHGGAVASGAVLQRNSQFHAKRDADAQATAKQQEQLHYTRQQAEQARLDHEAQLSQAQKQKAADFKLDAFKQLSAIDDPAQWTAMANSLDESYAQLFGQPSGSLKTGLQFSDAKKLTAGQKKAESALGQLEKRYDKAKLWEMNPTVTFDGQQVKYRALVDMAGLTATTDMPETPTDQPDAPTGAALPPSSPESAAPSMQSRAGVSHGKRVYANFNPKTGKYTDTQGNVLDDFSPAPPAASSGSNAGTGTMDADGVEYAATILRVTGKMPSLGNGGSGMKGAIVSRAAGQAKALGQSPVASIQRQAAYKADGSALTKMRSMASSASAFESKALSQADIVNDLSNKVSRSQIPLLNQAILAGKSELLGDKDTQLLYNAITTFSTEYAKIMEGSTGSASGSSDSARAAASKLISAKLSKGTLSATIELMKREMALTIQGYDAAIDSITERMGGTPPAAPAAPPSSAPSAIPSYQDYLNGRGK